ncbi:MAG: PIN domain-containing protein [Verrucomicrobia bacterium]|nr:PIN domain-containing protein [Verrucomicrobiota bacterium]
MKLIDTSSWIHSLRSGGDAQVSQRVADLLLSGEACWCAVVRVELWNGAKGAHEKRVLRDLEARLPELGMTAEVWEIACELARQARLKGLTVPTADLLIAACARHHDVAVEAADSHYQHLSQL